MPTYLRNKQTKNNSNKSSTAQPRKMGLKSSVGDPKEEWAESDRFSESIAPWFSSY